MQTIKIVHLFILLLLLKLLSNYVDYKFTIIVVIIGSIIFHLYSTNYLSFDVPLYNNIARNNEKSLEKNYADLKKLVIEINSIDKSAGAPNEIKNKLIDAVNTFIDNSSIVFNNDLKNCDLYIDSMHDQRNDILNIVSGYIINIPSYDNYDFFKNITHKFKDTIDIIFNVLFDKCAKDFKNKKIPINYDRYTIESGPQKDYKNPSSTTYKFSNRDSYYQF